MLTIYIEPSELTVENGDEITFVTEEGGQLVLEHSLISLSKWESIYHRPFLSEPPVTEKETRDYIECMTVSSRGKNLYERLDSSDLERINQYLLDSRTATTFRETPTETARKKIITSEMIYYQMIAHGIPFECQKWHISRLLTLLRVVDSYNAPQKKTSVRDLAARNRALNKERQLKYHTAG